MTKKQTNSRAASMENNACKIDSIETANKLVENMTHGMFVHTQNYAIFILLMTFRLHKSFVVFFLPDLPFCSLCVCIKRLMKHYVS